MQNAPLVPYLTLGRMAGNNSGLEGKSRGFSLNMREDVRCLIHSIITLNPIIAHNLPEINHRQVIIMPGQVQREVLK